MFSGLDQLDQLVLSVIIVLGIVLTIRIMIKLIQKLKLRNSDQN